MAMEQRDQREPAGGTAASEALGMRVHTIQGRDNKLAFFETVLVKYGTVMSKIITLIGFNPAVAALMA